MFSAQNHEHRSDSSEEIKTLTKLCHLQYVPGLMWQYDEDKLCHLHRNQIHSQSVIMKSIYLIIIKLKTKSISAQMILKKGINSFIYKNPSYTEKATLNSMVHHWTHKRKFQKLIKYPKYSFNGLSRSLAVQWSRLVCPFARLKLSHFIWDL